MTAFDNKITSKYLLESNLTPSGLEVMFVLHINSTVQGISSWASKMIFVLALAGFLLRASTGYFATLLQIGANTK